MVKNHLSYFRVDNFKKFSSLELADIGQFNLIVGDNNVGKTSLLEAISVFSRYDNAEQNVGYFFFPGNIKGLLKARGLSSDLSSDVIFNSILNSAVQKVDFFAKGTNYDVKLTLSKNLSEATYSAFGPDRNLLNNGVDIRGNSCHNIAAKSIPLVRSLMLQNYEMARLYQDVVNYSRINKLLIIENLQIVDDRIVDIEVLSLLSDPNVMIGLNNSDKFLPITSLGDSVIRVFIYLLEIIKNQGNFLSIDEIESGIHYSRLMPFLKTIFKLAIQNDIQLFMTTHSLECQQAFVEVFKDKEMQQFQSKARQFALLENDKGKIVANTQNYEQLQFALETGFDTRGGRNV